MIVTTTRFGALDIPEESLITLDGGMIGFPSETKFAWIPHRNSQLLAWLQSVATPGVAFPILNAVRLLEEGYPDVPVENIAEQAGVAFTTTDDLALMVVMSASELAPPTVNLMAPIVINTETRNGAQVVLNNTRFSTLMLAQKPRSVVPSASAGGSP